MIASDVIASGSLAGFISGKYYSRSKGVLQILDGIRQVLHTFANYYHQLDYRGPCENNNMLR